MVLSAAGALDHDDVVAQVEKLFSGIKSAEHKDLPPARYKGGTKVSRKPFEQSHIILAFQGLSYLDDEYYASQVFFRSFRGRNVLTPLSGKCAKSEACAILYTHSPWA